MAIKEPASLHDLELERIWILVSIASSFEGFDLIVKPLGDPGGEPGGDVVFDIAAVLSDELSELSEGTGPASRTICFCPAYLMRDLSLLLKIYGRSSHLAYSFLEAQVRDFQEPNDEKPLRNPLPFSLMAKTV